MKIYDDKNTKSLFDAINGVLGESKTEQLDEISQKMARAYRDKAGDDHADAQDDYEFYKAHKDNTSHERKRMAKRKKGMKMASAKIYGTAKVPVKENEQIDELKDGHTPYLVHLKVSKGGAKPHVKATRVNAPHEKHAQGEAKHKLEQQGYKVHGVHNVVAEGATTRLNGTLAAAQKARRDRVKNAIVHGKKLPTIKLTKGWGDGGQSMKANYGKLANESVNEMEDDEGWYTHQELHGKVGREDWKKGWRYNHRKEKPFYNSKTKTWHKSTNEEAEPLDEISMKKAREYQAKAGPDSVEARKASNFHHRMGRGGEGVRQQKKYDKRMKGMELAYKKASGKGNVPFSEETINELSPSLKGRYKAMARRNLDHAQDFKAELDHEGEPKKSPVRKDVNRIIKNRKKGLKRVGESTETIDELSKATVDRYVTKAVKRRDDAGWANMQTRSKKKRDANEKDYEKRGRGLKMAFKKLGESKEPLDEISKDLAKRYVNKAGRSISKMGDEKLNHMQKYKKPGQKTLSKDEWNKAYNSDKDIAKLNKKQNSRAKYQQLAKDKAKVNVRVGATEEYIMNEARGRPRKDGKTRDDDAGNVVMNLRKASYNSAGHPVKFKDGSTHTVNTNTARQVLDRHAAMKPHEKEQFQNHIHQSHDNLKNHHKFSPSGHKREIPSERHIEGGHRTIKKANRKGPSRLDMIRSVHSKLEAKRKAAAKRK